MKYRVTIARTTRNIILVDAKDEEEIRKAIEMAKQKGLVYDKFCEIESITHVDSFYGIGIEDASGNFGMTHGPTPELQKLLEVVPKFPLSKILELGEQNRVIFNWNSDEKKWVLVNEIKM
jgi:hypothetical protein